jgi:Cys-rich repeat protein
MVLEWIKKNRWSFFIIVVLGLIILIFIPWLLQIAYGKHSPEKILKKGCPEGSTIKDNKCYPPATTCPPAGCTTNSDCADGNSCLTGAVCGQCKTASDCIDPAIRAYCSSGDCLATLPVVT